MKTAKRTRGRPRLDVVRIKLTLFKSTIARARLIGHRNVSACIRKAVADYPEASILADLESRN